MTGPEHYTAAEELTRKAAQHRAAAEDNMEKARGSHLPEKDAYVTRAQVYALIYSGMMAEAGVHATLANAAAMALTGPVALDQLTTTGTDMPGWLKVATADAK